MSIPPARRVLLSGTADGTIPGILHVHTNRSDGRDSPDEVAAAAARAGLKFLVFSDHGDGTRLPDPPAYRAGVLCLDGVEISTNGGHYVAVGMNPSPYPLGGEPHAVVEDVRRLGGFGIVAHPDSPRAELRWRDWELPFDAIEVINLDTSWRHLLQLPGWQPKARLVQAFLAYPFRPEEAMANLLSAANTSIGRYQSLMSTRRVVALAGADAHAKLEFLDADPGDNRSSLPFPGYESLFRALSVHLRLASPFTGDPAPDAEAVLEALRAGRVYSAVNGLASPPEFRFEAVRQGTIAVAGEQIPAGEPVTLVVRSNAPDSFTTRIWRHDRLLAAGNTGQREPPLSVEAPGEGVYRAEILATDRPGEPPWIVSNPIYIGAPSETTSPPVFPVQAEPVDAKSLDDPSAWRSEADETSRGSVAEFSSTGGDGVVFDFALGEGVAARQFAAAVLVTPGGVGPYDRLAFTVRSDRPMRVSVQARAAVDPSRDDRWQRSVFVDSVERRHTVRFRDMTPVGETSTEAPAGDRTHSLLFVVELTNSRPGTAGRVWLREVALHR